MAALEELTKAEIDEVLAMEKFMAADLDWAEKPNNSNFLQAKANLVTVEGATIPGLTVDLRVRRGRFENDCLFNFSIFKFKNGRHLRLYQILVHPEDKASHQTPEGPWYGPYQHYGEAVEQFGADAPKGCADHLTWFKEFLKRANINFGGKYVPPPIQGDLAL